jgi:WD40 repeat protein
MKKILLFITFICAGCTESVLDPNDLGKGNGNNAPRTDRLYFVSTALDTFGFASPSVKTVLTQNASLPQIFSSDAFITSAPRGGKIALIKALGISVIDLADTIKSTFIPSGTQVIISATLSPDGKTLAYTMLSGNGQFPLGLAQIFVMRLDSIESLQFIEPAADIVTIPSFSPDGTMIAYVKKGDGIISFDSLMIAEVDGSGKSSIYGFPYGSSYDLELDWTSDGKQILFINDDRGFPGIGLIDVVAPNTIRTVIPSTQQYYSYPTLSAEGKTIAVVETDLSGMSTMRLYDLQGSLIATAESSSANSLIMPHFSSDSKQLAYCSVQGVFNPSDLVNSLMIQESNIILFDIAAGNRREVVETAVLRPLFER